MESFSGKFVIHEHTQSGQTHWDLMLERGNVLQTWRLDKAPYENPDIILAEKICDHDKKFLSYDGPVNNGLGNVKMIDVGIFQIIQESESRIQFNLSGKNLSGEFILKQMNKEQWRLSVHTRRSEP